MISGPFPYEFNYLDDECLWEELKAGNHDAFACMYHKNVQELYEYGMHLNADTDLIKDSIQELFIYIWQRRNSLGDIRSIRNYLMVSLRRLIFAHLEAQKKRNFSLLEKTEYQIESDVSHESRLIAKEIYVRQEQDLMTAVESLPPRQKEVIYLLFFKKISQKDIANMMSINLASVYTLTSKAIKNLKKQLK